MIFRSDIQVLLMQSVSKTGIIKNKIDGSILKSSTKQLCREREIKFYEQLRLQNDVDSMLLKELVPDYRGTEMVVIDGKPVSVETMEIFCDHRKMEKFSFRR